IKLSIQTAYPDFVVVKTHGLGGLVCLVFKERLRSIPRLSRRLAAARSSYHFRTAFVKPHQDLNRASLPFEASRFAAAALASSDR
ncbi:hypothetical protein, partial [Alicyclobacillus fructus]|uniref:hypothetical protein n=1 Tax=Alicyclobacillus fructus TaxID=2816082 RepID=UPI001A8DAD13